MIQPPPPLPLPMHLQNQQAQQVQQQQQTVPSFQMTASYSSNSQNSKASSLLGNTASTGVSTSCSPPPLPPPLQMSQNGGLFNSATYASYVASPSKNMHMQNSTNLFASKFGNANTLGQTKPSPPSSTILTANTNTNTRIYRDLDPANSLRLSQRNFSQQSTFHNANNLNHIPNSNANCDANNQFELWSLGRLFV